MRARVRVRAVDSANARARHRDRADHGAQEGQAESVNFSGSFAKVRTDAQGIATFDWLPSDIQAGTGFRLGTLSYSTPKWPDSRRRRAELGTDDATAPAHADLGKGHEARRLARIGNPRGRRWCRQCVPAGSGVARTGADGSYTMEVPPEQSYMVHVRDDEWATRTLTGVVVREGQARSGIDIRLERGSLISGRVMAGQPPQPAAGVALMLSEQGPDVPKGTFPQQPAPLIETCVRIVDTDSDGRYAFRVGPGDYQLTEPQARGPGIEPEQLKVGGGDDIQRDFHVSQLGRPWWQRLRGVVRLSHSDGPPIAGAIVVAEPIGARIPPSHGFADDKGRFELFRSFDTSFDLRPRSEGKLRRLRGHGR